MKSKTWFFLVAMTLASARPVPAAAAGAESGSAATPPELVASYNSLADVVLGVRQTEQNIVKAILATTYGHAEATLAAIRTEFKAGGAKGNIEKLAALVSQLGSEGDASVGAIRKRLLEGGHHHHNTEAERRGEFEDGFVIVTRVAKKAFLDSAARIGKLSTTSDLGAVEAEWAKVRALYVDLMKGAKS